MSAGAPWSVKGIDPKAREVAKDLARRAGMTLGEWLNRVILEDDVPEEVTSHAHFTAGARPRFEGAPAGFTQVYRPEAGYPDDLGRIAVALDRLTDRIEASETRTGLAISGVEHSVRHAMARIETAEREHMTVAARFDAAAERLDAEQARAADRLRRIELEASGPRSAEALKALEQSVTRVATHLYEGESRTRDVLAGLEARVGRAEALSGADPDALVEEMVGRLGARLGAAEGHTTQAIESLRGSLAALDNRMRAVEGGSRPDLEQRLESLADQLAQRVDDARREVAERLAATGAGQMEARLSEITAQIDGLEQRSTKGIESMGREVLTMADTLNRRVQSAEQRSAEAIEQVGGEIARIAGAVENRLGRVDQLHAEALERLGGEIGRITERLTDRIIQSERRAAQAIDGVGEQVSKVTERIEQRHDRASTDLAERIRQSEARTAALLEAARVQLLGDAAPSAIEATLEPPVAESEAFAPEAPTPQADAPPPLAIDAERAAAEAVAAPVELEVQASTESANADDDLPPLSAVFGPELLSRAEPMSQPALDPVNPAFGQEDFEAVAGFAPIVEIEDDLLTAEASEPEHEVKPETPQLSTREVIEQARAAARAAMAAPRPKITKGGRGGSVRLANGGGLFAAMKRRPPSTWQTALLVAGGAAFLSVGAAGVVLLEGPGGQSNGRVTLPFAYPERAAVALTPGPASPLGSDTAPPPAEPSPAPGADYAAAVRAVEQHQPGALDRLKTIAETDDIAAQMYLAKLYEGGESGTPVNLAEARRWTARAAENGDASAMHNLALYYFRGEGGPQNAIGAAQWFRKAAERGIVDSQYNLGLLYQSGSGVARDPAQAYRWFSLAGAAGDNEARAKAAAIAPTLTQVQLAAAQSAISSFQTAAPGRAAAAAQHQAASRPTPGLYLQGAQRVLSNLGYYKGRADGTVSHDLHVAVANYQRDQGLTPTGVLDPTTSSRLAVLGR